MNLRRIDILKLDSHILDRIQNIYDHDLFYSKDSDENLVDLILDSCDVLFLPVEKRSQVDLFASTFICSYRFNAQNKMIIRLKYGASLKLQQMQPEKNTVERNSSLTSRSKMTSDEKLITELQLTDETSSSNIETKRSRPGDPFESISSEDLQLSKKRKTEIPVRHALLEPLNEDDSTFNQEKVLSTSSDKKRSRSKSKDRKTKTLEDPKDVQDREGERDQPIEMDNDLNLVSHVDIMDISTRAGDGHGSPSASKVDIKVVSDVNTDDISMSAGDGNGSPSADRYFESFDENENIVTAPTESTLKFSESDRDNQQQVSPRTATTRVDESTAFRRMCSVMRDQVIARYSGTVTLSEEDANHILEEIWSEMEPEEKEAYFVHEEFDPESIHEQNLQTQSLEYIESEETSETSSEGEIEGDRQDGDSEVSSDSSEDEVTSTQNINKNKGVSTLVTRSMAAKAQEPFMVVKAKNTESIQDLRVGDDYQAKIPSIMMENELTTAETHSLISTPTHINSEEFNEYLTAAVMKGYKILFDLMRVDNKDPVHRLDGAFIVIAVPVEMIAMEAYNEWYLPAKHDLIC